MHLLYIFGQPVRSTDWPSKSECAVVVSGVTLYNSLYLTQFLTDLAQILDSNPDDQS